jgi:hypothetical protein
VTICALILAFAARVCLHASINAPKIAYSAPAGTIGLFLAEKCILITQLILSLSIFISLTLIFNDSTRSFA